MEEFSRNALSGEPDALKELSPPEAEAARETEAVLTAPVTESEPEPPQAETVTPVAQAVPKAPESVSEAETPEAASAPVTQAVPETPDAQADTGDAPEAAETRKKPKGVPRKHPANKKTDKKGSRKPRKVALKPRNGKES